MQRCCSSACTPVQQEIYSFITDCSSCQPTSRKVLRWIAAQITLQRECTLVCAQQHSVYRLHSPKHGHRHRWFGALDDTIEHNLFYFFRGAATTEINYFRTPTQTATVVLFCCRVDQEWCLPYACASVWLGRTCVDVHHAAAVRSRGRRSRAGASAFHFYHFSAKKKNQVSFCIYQHSFPRCSFFAFFRTEQRRMAEI